MKTIHTKLNLSHSFLLLLLFCMLCLFINTSKAQSYHTLDANREAYFEASTFNSQFYGEFLNKCEGLDCLIGIRIDSISPDSQSLFFPVYARSEEYSTGICSSNSWLGPKVHFLANGKELFFNGIGGLQQYMTCLGLWSRYEYIFSDFYNKNLVYYKKGSEEWGTPIDFEQLTPIEEINTLSNQYKVFPNPANESVHIHIANTVAPITSWILYDLNGVLRKQAQQLIQQQIKIEVANLPTGLYHLEIINKDGFHYRQPLVVSH